MEDPKTTREINLSVKFGRTNNIEFVVLSLAMFFASWPRLVIEVFIRRNFGERYYTLASAISVFLLLAFIPVARIIFIDYGYVEWGDFFKNYLTWYLFLFVFLFFGWLRYLETKRNPSVFDLEKYSLYSGDFLPALKKFMEQTKSSVRHLEIFYEPGAVFIIGLILALAGQPLGTLLIVCSIIYSLSSAGAYRQSDHYIMDQIDKMILLEEFEKAFVDDKAADQTRHVSIPGRKPATKELRKKIADQILKNAPVEPK